MNIARDMLALSLAVTLATAAAAQTGDKPTVDPARWVPENALVYGGVSDIATLRDKIKSTAFYKLTQDPDAEDVRSEVSILRKLYEEFKTRVAKALDTEPDQLRNPFGGPVAIYVPAPKSPGESPGVVFVAGVGDPGLMKDYYDRATRKLRDAVDNYERISFGSVTIDEFTSESSPDEETQDPNEGDLADLGINPDEADVATALNRLFGKLFSSDSIPDRLALCLADNRLIVAATPDEVKDVLRRERSGNSLVDAEIYQTMSREFKPLGSLRFLINLSGLFDLMVSTDGDEASKTLAMLGARGMHGVIGHWLIGDNQAFESKFEAMLLLTGERTGLAKIFSMQNLPVAPPDSISAENLMYMSLALNAMETLDEIERMIRRVDPAAADQMRAGMESMPLPNGETLNIRKELLENLRAPLTFAMAFQRPFSPQSTRLRLSIGLADKQAMTRFLEKVSSLAGGMLIEREFRGTMVYDVGMFGFSVAPTDDALVAGTTNAVEAALQTTRPEHALAADPTFKKVAALAPSEAWGVVYVDSRRMFEAALTLAENKQNLVATQFTNPANWIAYKLTEAISAGVDEEHIEQARRLIKYQAPGIATIATTPEGIRLTQIQLAPDTGGSE